MSISEFNQGIRMLNNFYGKTEKTGLNDFQKEAWFDRLQYLSYAKFYVVINRLFETSKYMPTLSEILNLARETKVPTTQKEEIHVECKNCRGIGLIEYYRRKSEYYEGALYKYYARCTCENGDNYKHNELLLITEVMPDWKGEPEITADRIKKAREFVQMNLKKIGR